MNKMSLWNDKFLRLAAEIASWSHDPSTKVGCVIASADNRVLSTGYNGLPRGVSDCKVGHPERHERPEKYNWYVHAEANAIYNAANLGHALKDSVAYVTMQPCITCTHGIIQSGIKRVVWEVDMDEKRKARWAEDHQRALQMFKEAGVTTQPRRTYPPHHS
jgi:dCMP deaminase